MALSPPPAAWWHPEALRRRLPMLQARSRIQAALRARFAAWGFQEVETPALQVSPGLEPHLAAFATELQAPDGGRRELYLHTSPEYAMKKLLVAGSGPIFQFARVWRNGERSATHHPEFTMLEWYRPGAVWQALLDDCEALLAAALAAAQTEVFRWQGRESRPDRLEVLSVAEAFQRHAGLDLLASLESDGTPDATVLAKAARAAGIRVPQGEPWEDVFFRVFLERIEPQLGWPRPTVLCDWLAAMAALSRRKPGDPRLAERFELYVCGLELANAFGELTDPVEQRRRFLADQAHRRALYGSSYPIDEEFLQALACGLPESAGIALGFDRLVMLATGAAAIEEVLWAPVAEASPPPGTFAGWDPLPRRKEGRMQHADQERPLTADDVRSIVGGLEEDTVARVVETGATSAELVEAFMWLTADDQVAREAKRIPSGRVAVLCEMLAPDLAPPDPEEL